MVAAAESGEIDVIVAYSTSRLTRRPRELDDPIQLHERTKVKVRDRGVRRLDLSCADGRALARTLAAWDAAEAERVAERVSRASTAVLGAGPGRSSQARQLPSVQAGAVVRALSTSLRCGSQERVAAVVPVIGTVVGVRRSVRSLVQVVDDASTSTPSACCVAGPDERGEIAEAVEELART